MTLKIHTLGTLAAATFIASSHAELIGHWAFDEGVGTLAADSSGKSNDGAITGGTWGSDATRETYIIMDGISGSVVDPNVTLPTMTTDNDFTWAFWANSQGATGNAIIIGNRYDEFGTDYAPRQFVKFTPTKFEWHQEGGGADNQEYDDLVSNEWHHHVVVKTGLSVQYYRDGIPIGAPGTLNGVNLDNAVPMRFFIGGNTGTASAGEVFNGFIDDVRIYDEALTQEDIQDLIGPGNLPPFFTEDPLTTDDATVGTPFDGTIADQVADANPGDTLTITKLDGPSWLVVGTDGSLSGDAAASDAGLNRFTVQVSDGSLNNTAALYIIVVDPDAAPAPDSLFGSWPLDEGSGDLAADISGNNFDAIITNLDTGGLGIDGSAWAEDLDFGTVLSFNGTNGTGAFATVGFPPAFGSLPAMDLENEFTWSLWARSENDLNNDTMLGNRFAPNGSDYVPREFIKFTPLQFEFHTSGAPQNIDYDDLVVGEWVHHVAVKDGADLSYYRNGVIVSSITITEAPLNELPLYFGGFGTENWQGYLSDVRLWERALSAGEALTLYNDKILGAAEVIEITEIVVGENNDITLTWTSRANTSYVLEASTTLEKDDWLEIDDSIVATGDTTTVNLPGNAFPNASEEDKLIFRVRKSAP